MWQYCESITIIIPNSWLYMKLVLVLLFLPCTHSWIKSRVMRWTLNDLKFEQTEYTVRPLKYRFIYWPLSLTIQVCLHFIGRSHLDNHDVLWQYCEISCSLQAKNIYHSRKELSLNDEMGINRVRKMPN